MRTLHSFLHSVFLFVKSLAVKVTKEMYRTSSVLVTAMVVIAVIAFASNGFGGSGKNALAAPITETMEAVPEEEETEGSNLVTEAETQFELLNTDDEGRQLAGALLEQNVREKRERQDKAQAEIEALQKQILTEKQEEEEKKASRKYSVSDEDYQILLRIVQAEAGGCDAKGKILVANVVMNRVHSKTFPETVKSVVYQRSQFQPVSTGVIDSVKVSSETVACVDRALAGEDYSEGALYFMNRKASGKLANWFDNRLTYLFAHDGHEFFK